MCSRQTSSSSCSSCSYSSCSCSSWSSSCSSYMILLGLVPLILISGVAFMMTSPKTTIWGSVSYTPWLWSFGARPTILPSSVPAAKTSGGGVTLFTEDNQTHGGLQPRVVGVPQREKALSSEVSTYNQSSSSLPTHANQTINIIQPEEKKQQEKFIGSTDGSNATHDFLMEKNNCRQLEHLEAGLARARAAVKEAATTARHVPDSYYVPQGPVYQNSHAFQRSYLEMEKRFKVFVYEQGEPPLFHNGPCKSIYSMEGNFIHMMEVEQQMQTRDPEEAHVFFLPFSIAMMVHYVYVSNSHDFGPIKRTVVDYVDAVSKKYSYWNRSLGADHFMLACHDWGPEASKVYLKMYRNSIRALCNANTSEGFKPSKDVSIPEINLLSGDMKGLVGGPSPSKRPILAFFAGGLHGPIRPLLLQHWEDRDSDIQVHKYLRKGMSYQDMMKRSKFCICPSGYEVASPRIVEALYSGCVPVLISDHYVPPFSDVLNWKSFSVHVPVHEIPNLKNILMNISPRQYIRMQRRGLIARKHFEVNSPPKRFDVFYMILHSVWLRRLNVHIHD